MTTTSHDAISVRFYDGQRSVAHSAVMYPIEGGIAIQVHQQCHLFRYDQINVLGGLGQLMPVLELPEEMRVELLQTQLPTWMQSEAGHLQQRIWHLERSPTLILLSLVLVVGVVFGLARFGMPMFAHYLAFALPADSLSSIGEQTQSQLFDMTGDTTLDAAKQAHIRQLYERYIEPEQGQRLLFRQGQMFDANAFALPNGKIVLTDELVQLASNDQALIGVLAHEHGHLVERHSLQQAISGIGVSVMVAWLTGDVSDLMSGLPTALLTMHYSRDFEREADQYAIKQLQAQRVSVLPLADFLARLEQRSSQQPADDQHTAWATAWLNSHPATQERINAIRQAEQYQREYR